MGNNRFINQPSYGGFINAGLGLALRKNDIIKVEPNGCHLSNIGIELLVLNNQFIVTKANSSDRPGFYIYPQTPVTDTTKVFLQHFPDAIIRDVIETPDNAHNFFYYDFVSDAARIIWLTNKFPNLTAELMNNLDTLKLDHVVNVILPICPQSVIFQFKTDNIAKVFSENGITLIDIFCLLTNLQALHDIIMHKLQHIMKVSSSLRDDKTIFVGYDKKLIPENTWIVWLNNDIENAIGYINGQAQDFKSLVTSLKYWEEHINWLYYNRKSSQLTPVDEKDFFKIQMNRLGQYYLLNENGKICRIITLDDYFRQQQSRDVYQKRKRKHTNDKAVEEKTQFELTLDSPSVEVIKEMASTIDPFLFDPPQVGLNSVFAPGSPTQFAMPITNEKQNILANDLETEKEKINRNNNALS